METTPKKINVLFVIVKMRMGGSEHLVWDLIRNLDRQRFTPHLAWFYDEVPLPQFVDLNIPLFYVPKVRRLDFRTMRQLATIIKNRDIGLVNAHHYLSFIYSFFGCKIAGRSGLIYTEHTVWEIEALSRKWKIAGRVLLRFADGTVGISDKVSAGLARIFKLSGKNLHTIPNGVDCQVLSFTQDNGQHKKKLGYSPDDIVIGMVANLKKNKNHIFLLKVFNQLQRNDKRLKLLFIGKAFENDLESSEKEIREYIGKFGLGSCVSLLGARTDVPDLLKVLDIFCLTSYQEGLPISLIEAMATGLPAIGTEVEGIKDLIIDGSNGYLVELNNESQLMAALQKLIEDPLTRSRFGKKSRELILEDYTLEKCTQKYTMLFEKFSAP